MDDMTYDDKEGKSDTQPELLLRERKLRVRSITPIDPKDTRSAHF
jgi:hypothetical protein